ncbi:hypothetical protein ACFQU2_24695 [Siccirubricoccus deserti]
MYEFNNLGDSLGGGTLTETQGSTRRGRSPASASLPSRRAFLLPPIPDEPAGVPEAAALAGRFTPQAPPGTLRTPRRCRHG